MKMEVEGLDIEVTYLKKGASSGGVFYTEKTLQEIVSYEVGEEFVCLYKSDDASKEESGAPLAILIPTKDIVNIKAYKR